MKFQIEQVPGGDGFQFRLLSNAGDVWLTSSTFADRDGCTAAIRTAIERIADEGNFENRAEDGQFFAVLSDENGARLAISEGLVAQPLLLRESVLSRPKLKSRKITKLP